MPSRKPTYRRKKNRNHKRNNAIREALMARGMTEEDARKRIEEAGKARHDRNMEIVQRKKAERQSRKRTDDVHR